MTQAGLPVHDLDDHTSGRGPRRAAPPTRYVRGAASAALALAALLAAGTPGGDRPAHLVVAAVLGVLAALVGIRALRRARRVGALVLPTVALLLTVAATVALAMRPPDSDDPDIVTVALPLTAEAAATGVPVESGPGDHRALTTALDGMLLRLQSVHQEANSYPATLARRGPWVIVADGPDSGASIGRLPPSTQLTYGITADRAYFQLTITTRDALPVGVMGDSLVRVAAP